MSDTAEFSPAPQPQEITPVEEAPFQLLPDPPEAQPIEQSQPVVQPAAEATDFSRDFEIKSPEHARELLRQIQERKAALNMPTQEIQADLSAQNQIEDEYAAYDEEMPHKEPFLAKLFAKLREFWRSFRGK